MLKSLLYKTVSQQRLSYMFKNLFSYGSRYDRFSKKTCQLNSIMLQEIRVLS